MSDLVRLRQVRPGYGRLVQVISGCHGRSGYVRLCQDTSGLVIYDMSG
jgi:hypothetical protein